MRYNQYQCLVGFRITLVYILWDCEIQSMFLWEENNIIIWSQLESEHVSKHKTTLIQFFFPYSILFLHCFSSLFSLKIWYMSTWRVTDSCCEHSLFWKINLLLNLFSFLKYQKKRKEVQNLNDNKMAPPYRKSFSSVRKERRKTDWLSHFCYFNLYWTLKKT